MGKKNKPYSIYTLNEQDIVEHYISRESKAEREEGVDFETAIAATGYGKFHYILLLLCGFSFGSFSCETLNVSFLMPAAQCDLDLTSQDKGWLSAITFVGMMFGSYIWGSLGDSLGRKEILIISLLMESICSLFSSLAQQFALFLVLKFFAGVGLSGILVVFSFFAEFQPAAKRGGMISLLDAFYIEGNVAMTCLAWLVIPQSFAYVTDSFTYDSWRLFTALCASMALIAALGLLWLPESPKFLLAKGRHDEALQVLRRVFHENTGKPENDFPYTRLILDVEDSHSETLPFFKKLRSTFSTIADQSRTLFKPPLLRSILLTVFIQFVLQFSNAGLLLWLPQLFENLENYMAQHPNASVTICQVVNAGNGTEIDTGCQPGQQVYINALIIAIAPLPGNVWTFLHMDKLGRKFFIAFGLLSAGVCALLVLVIKSPVGDLVVTACFNFFGNMAFNAINVLTTELFPTTVRSTAFSITFVSARLGSILGTVTFGALIDVMCELPIGLFTAFLIGGGLMALLLPNTTGKA